MIEIRKYIKEDGNCPIDAELNRERLDKALTAKGNPKLETLTAVLHTMGLKLPVAPLASHG